MRWNEVNEMFFGEKDVKAGKHIDFVKCLLAIHPNGMYVDMHVREADLGGVSVEWTVEPWSEDYGGHWQYVRDDMDERVVRDVTLPDGSTVEVNAREPDEKVVYEWLEEHRDEGWEKDWLGQWSSAADRKSYEELRKQAFCESGKASEKAEKEEGREGE